MTSDADPKATLLSVDSQHQGERVDAFLQHALTLSRLRTKALFEQDAVRKNGRRCKKGDFLAAGDVVAVKLKAESTPAAVADAALPLSILHEDASLVFVDKPTGQPTHPLLDGEVGTLANALIARFPNMQGVGDDLREAGVCHRLDTETSGVLVAAKTRDAWLFMRQQFKAGDVVDKRYLALVQGPIADDGEIDLPLLHMSDYVRPSFDEKARPASSRFTVTARSGIFSLVDVQIVTGVLHQVRAHLSAIGAPIVGDTRYGGSASSRLFLHAQSLTVTHPETLKPLTVKSPPPDSFRLP